MTQGAVRSAARAGDAGPAANLRARMDVDSIVVVWLILGLVTLVKMPEKGLFPDVDN